MSTHEDPEYRVCHYCTGGPPIVEWRPAQRAREEKRRKLTIAAAFFGTATVLLLGIMVRSWTVTEHRSIVLSFGAALCLLGCAALVASRGDMDKWRLLLPTPRQAAAQAVLGTEPVKNDDGWYSWSVPAERSAAITEAWLHEKRRQEQESRDAAQKALERAAGGKDRAYADAE